MTAPFWLAIGPLFPHCWEYRLVKAYNKVLPQELATSEGNCLPKDCLKAWTLHSTLSSLWRDFCEVSWLHCSSISMPCPVLTVLQEWFLRALPSNFPASETHVWKGCTESPVWDTSQQSVSFFSFSCPKYLLPFLICCCLLSYILCLHEFKPIFFLYCHSVNIFKRQLVYTYVFGLLF